MQDTHRGTHFHVPLFLFAYTALLIYGTLYPLRDWSDPGTGFGAALAASLSGYVSRADMVTNLLVYMPFGLLLGFWLRKQFSRGLTLISCALAGFSLSLGLEFAQLFLPNRHPSLIDLGLNTLGALAGGALLALGSRNTTVGQRLLAWRREWVVPDATANLGLIAVAVWVLSQLSPFVPSIDVGNLRQGLSPLYRTLLDPSAYNPGKGLAYALSVFAIGLLALSFSRIGGRRFLAMFALFIASVFALKVPVVTRQVSLEAVTGALVAFALLGRALRLPEPRRFRLALIILVAAYVVEQLRPGGGPGAATHAFAWSVFESNMLNIHGFSDLLGTMWPFIGLAYLTLSASPQRPGVVALMGGTGILAATFGLEWLQTIIPGRYPDVTDVIVAAAAWTGAFIFCAPQRSGEWQGASSKGQVARGK